MKIDKKFVVLWGWLIVIYMFGLLMGIWLTLDVIEYCYGVII